MDRPRPEVQGGREAGPSAPGRHSPSQWVCAVHVPGPPRCWARKRLRAGSLSSQEARGREGRPLSPLHAPVFWSVPSTCQALGTKDAPALRGPAGQVFALSASGSLHGKYVAPLLRILDCHEGKGKCVPPGGQAEGTGVAAAPFPWT